MSNNIDYLDKVFKNHQEELNTIFKNIKQIEFTINKEVKKEAFNYHSLIFTINQVFLSDYLINSKISEKEKWNHNDLIINTSFFSHNFAKAVEYVSIDAQNNKKDDFLGSFICMECVNGESYNFDLYLFEPNNWPHTICFFDKKGEFLTINKRRIK